MKTEEKKYLKSLKRKISSLKDNPISKLDLSMTNKNNKEKLDHFKAKLYSFK